MGHIVDHATGMHASDMMSVVGNPRTIARWVSGYGSTHPSEAFAEAFSMVAAGHPEDIRGTHAGEIRQIVTNAADALSTHEGRAAIYAAFRHNKLRP
jgi:hypothetical protein